MTRRSLWKSNATRRFGLALLLAGCVMLASCKKELYANLGEQDVNEMAVALLERGVNADKISPDGGKTYVLQVESTDMVRAMQILGMRGLPRSRFDDLGNLFKKEGLVSTPTEERVRFIYGLSQELSGTLSHIDGVMYARVQIVLPNNDPLAQQAKPSSAAVFIKYRPESDIDALVPQIKNLVVHSVEGLSYDQVSVTAVAAEPMEIAAASPAQSDPMRWIVSGVVVLLIVIGGVAAVVRRHTLQQRLKPAADLFNSRLSGLAALRRKRDSSA